MELDMYLFFILCGCLFAFIRLLQQNISIYERFFLILIILTLAYVGYNGNKKTSSDKAQVKEQVSTILSYIEDDVHMPLEKVLETDPKLLKSMLGLVKFIEYDKDTVIQVFKDLNSFYNLYADILLDAKPIHLNDVALVDMRFKILGKLHSIFVSLPYMKNTYTLEYITLMIQASTYKCLNVLKNKHGMIQHETPLPNNTFENAFNVY